MNAFFTPARRQYLYGLATAALAVAIGYKLISADAVPLWLALVSAALGIGATGTAVVAVQPDAKADRAARNEPNAS